MNAIGPLNPMCRRGRLGPRRHESHKGFTMIELIMVIVILGVLAVFAVPRIFDSSVFNAQGFHDATMAYLRFAQKTAIAQRRTVCVTFSTNSITLAEALNAPDNTSAVTDCSAAVTSTQFLGPDGKAPPTLTSSNAAYSTPTPTSFNFNGLGQPITAAGASMATQTLQVVGAARAITIEGATGFVHD